MQILVFVVPAVVVIAVAAALLLLRRRRAGAPDPRSNGHGNRGGPGILR